MLFNSQIFIFLFLPLTLGGWYLINHLKWHRAALLFLTGMSLWFYGYFNPSYLLIILGSMTGNYLISVLVEKWKGKNAPKVCLALGLLLNLCILGYYKYYDFFVENVNAVFHADFSLKHIVLPLGISFFTLQQLSYVIDRCWGTAPHYKLLDYLCFVTFFPQLIAGPIVLHSELIPQFQNVEKRSFSAVDFADGTILFCLGLIKKVLLADTIAIFVNEGFTKVWWLDTPSAWLVAACYALELYFDFSGYCDMAVGIGKMFRLELPVNFRSPFKSHSVPEYWQRWHYTLTRFLQTYLYVPLTMKGMRKKNKKVKKFYGIMTPLIVFLVSGIWHGASWTFVLWGLCEGIATVWAQRKFWKLKKNGFTWFCTFLFTVFTSAIFRSESWQVMCRFLKAMFVPSVSKIFIELTYAYENLSENYVWSRVVEQFRPNLLFFAYPLFWLLLILIATWILRGKNAQEILADQKTKGYTAKFTAALVILTAWAIISLNQVSTFLYFNF